MPPWDYLFFCSFLFAARMRKDALRTLGYLGGEYFFIWGDDGYCSLGMGGKTPCYLGCQAWPLGAKPSQIASVFRDD